MKYEDQERQDKNPQPKNSGSLYLARFGIGRWHFGKNDYQFSADTGIERFRTTVFILLFYFPLIPTGSYLIEKKRGWFSRRITILKRLSLDWAQVARVWVVAATALLLILWVLKRV
jgi:hypothetical protein